MKKTFDVWPLAADWAQYYDPEMAALSEDVAEKVREIARIYNYQASPGEGGAILRGILIGFARTRFDALANELYLTPDMIASDVRGLINGIM